VGSKICNNCDYFNPKIAYDHPLDIYGKCILKQRDNWNLKWDRHVWVWAEDTCGEFEAKGIRCICNHSKKSHLSSHYQCGFPSCSCKRFVRGDIENLELEEEEEESSLN
jgi:hypothetical protein